MIRKHRLFSSFAGVMLADILANSVALLIILITITISIKHETEQKRLEQVEDVSVLLSREIARSVVINSLPASAPAMLHDYKTSPLDRNPSPFSMPIIELRRGHVRNYYTGEIYPRDELLLQDNAFDRYLRTLPRPLLLRTRIDIYNIDLFYIVMSILKSYDLSPRHWHFLVDPVGGSGQGGKPEMSLLQDSPDGDENGESSPGTGDKPGEGENTSGTDGEMTEEDASWGLPADATFDIPAESGAYPRDTIAYGSGQSAKEQGQQQTLNLPGEIGQRQNENVRQSDELFDALSDMIGSSMEQQQNGQQQNAPQTARFRTATNEQQQQSGQSMAVQLPHFRLILPALFSFMEQAQTFADTRSQSLLAKFDFMKQLLPLVTQITERPEQKLLFDGIMESMEKTPEHDQETIHVRAKTDTALRANVIAVSRNQRVTIADLIGNEHQPPLDGIPGERNLSSRLSLYPAIYRGIRSPLRDGMLVLMPPEQKDPNTYRWRVATFVSPNIDDWVVAFVYSAIGDDGQLLMTSDENVIELDDVGVATHYPIVPLRGSLWTFILYGLAALLITLGIFRTFRRAV